MSFDELLERPSRASDRTSKRSVRARLTCLPREKEPPERNRRFMAQVSRLTHMGTALCLRYNSQEKHPAQEQRGGYRFSDIDRRPGKQTHATRRDRSFTAGSKHRGSQVGRRMSGDVKLESEKSEEVSAKGEFKGKQVDRALPIRRMLYCTTAQSSGGISKGTRRQHAARRA